MMKRVGFCILLFIATLHTTAMSNEVIVPLELREEIEVETLRPFFNALKSGNVRQIERYLSGKKLAEVRFSEHYEDKEYEESLREHYRGAIFSIERAALLNDQIIVDVKIEFPGRGSKITQFYLQQQAHELNKANKGAIAIPELRWNIIEQRHDQVQMR